MRKVDYALLASLIRGFLADDSHAAKDSTTRSAVIVIALTFAARANVNRDAFLLQCGIDPQGAHK